MSYTAEEVKDKIKLYQLKETLDAMEKRIEEINGKKTNSNSIENSVLIKHVNTLSKDIENIEYDNRKIKSAFNTLLNAFADRLDPNDTFVSTYNAAKKKFERENPKPFKSPLITETNIINTNTSSNFNNQVKNINVYLDAIFENFNILNKQLNKITDVLNFVVNEFSEVIEHKDKFIADLEKELSKHEKETNELITDKNVIDKKLNKENLIINKEGEKESTLIVKESFLTKRKNILDANRLNYDKLADKYNLIKWDEAETHRLKYGLPYLRAAVTSNLNRLHSNITNRIYSSKKSKIKLVFIVDLSEYSIRLGEDTEARKGYKVSFETYTRPLLKDLSFVSVQVFNKDFIDNKQGLNVKVGYDKLLISGNNNIINNALFCLRWVLSEISQSSIDLNPLVDGNSIVNINNTVYNNTNKELSTGLLPSIVTLMSNVSVIL